MRYFLLIFVVACVATVGILGFRGGTSRKPPVEIFPDMDRQAKLRPQTYDSFLQNNQSSQTPVPGTIAREKPLVINGKEVFPFEDSPVNTGRITGTTNFIENNPLPITEKLLARGQERFQISCLPCHGALADGNGITKKLGMAVVANLHDARIVKLPDGEIFNTITHGKNLMGAYGPNVAPEDRWAIIAYVRALQRSQLATIDDVPKQMQSLLKK
jgi:cbb3-type cytochrome c oxidase subunit III